MKLYNTLTRKTEEFTTLKPQKATIYVCGITPYDTTHLGHAFTYLCFDVLIRYLIFKGYAVAYTQNVTDINDRDGDILERARQKKISWQKLAKYWTDKFLDDMMALNWIAPTYYLKASEHISDMVKLIRKLIKNGLAYTGHGSVYLDITKSQKFGKLSGLSKTQMMKKSKDYEEDLGNPDKRNPLDITLWRSASTNQPPHIPAFDSPFSKGRPGWHIECSAMSIYSLGQQIDVHGGGQDLIFPHHEAEIAQSEGATGKIPFAKFWVHTGQVHYQGEKMSKSKGNIVMVSDLLKKYSANAIRWLLLSHHYRESWEFKEADLVLAQKQIEGIESNLSHCDTKMFSRLMDNDLQTPKVLDLLHQTHNQEIFTALGFTK